MNLLGMRMQISIRRRHGGGGPAADRGGLGAEDGAADGSEILQKEQ